MSFHEKTTHASKGKWRGILLTLGLPEACLKNKHGPCPLCDSKDNFRFDDKDGRGTYICTCGAGDGMALAMAYTGKSFREIAPEIDKMLGNLTKDTPRPQMSDAKRRDILRDTYRATRPVEAGDLVHTYLATRGVDEMIYPDALRFAPRLTDGDGGIRPCMVAMVGVHGQSKPVSMHRTFLKPDGSGKAEMASPRKMMPGELPDGACVMLSDYTPGGPIGIAEGIETAMSASALFSMPVWAAISTSGMMKWIPPQGAHDVTIFGDNDRKFGGHKAAWHLAHKLAVAGLSVSVRIPDASGEDWNDVWMNEVAGGQK